MLYLHIDKKEYIFYLKSAIYFLLIYTLIFVVFLFCSLVLYSLKSFFLSTSTNLWDYFYLLVIYSICRVYKPLTLWVLYHLKDRDGKRKDRDGKRKG